MKALWNTNFEPVLYIEKLFDFEQLQTDIEFANSTEIQKPFTQFSLPTLSDLYNHNYCQS